MNREKLLRSYEHDIADLKQKLVAEKARADKAEAALKEEKQWSEDLAKQCCEMEDALGFKQDQHDASGAFMPTMGPWKERVRDLIAKESELEEIKERKPHERKQ